MSDWELPPESREQLEQFKRTVAPYLELPAQFLEGVTAAALHVKDSATTVSKEAFRFFEEHPYVALAGPALLAIAAWPDYGQQLMQIVGTQAGNSAQIVSGYLDNIVDAVSTRLAPLFQGPNNNLVPGLHSLRRSLHRIGINVSSVTTPQELARLLFIKSYLLGEHELRDVIRDLRALSREYTVPDFLRPPKDEFGRRRGYTRLTTAFTGKCLVFWHL